MPHLMIPVSEVQAGSKHMESRTGRINLFNVLSLCWALNKGVVRHTHTSHTALSISFFSSRHLVKSALQLQDYIQHHATVSKQGQVLKKKHPVSFR